MDTKQAVSISLIGLSLAFAGCNKPIPEAQPAKDQSVQTNEAPPAVAASPMPANYDVLIEAYGDSTTVGETLVNGNTTTVERPVSTIIQEALNTDFAGKVAISNEGVSGSQAVQLLNGSDGKHKPWAEQMKISKANIVLLNFGLNEAFYLKNPAPQFEPMPPEKFAETLRSLVKIARENGKTPVLVEPNPTCDKERGDSVQYYAMRVDEVGKELQVPVIGSYWEISKANGWKSKLSDCVHPNQSLYAEMAALQYGTLKPLVQDALK